MSSPHARAAAAVLAAALLGHGPAARGEGGGSDPEWADARAGAAARLVEYADWRGEHAPALARDHYRIAAELDPANLKAVDGARGKPSDAGARPPKSPPSKGPSVRPTPKSDPKVPTLGEVASTEDLAYREAAVPLAAVATARAARKDESGAREAWLAVVSLDPGHEAARTALGVQRAETGWLRGDGASPSEAIDHYRRLPLAGNERMPAPSQEEFFQGRSDGDAPYSRSEEARFRAKSYNRSAEARGLLRTMLRVEAFLHGTEQIAERSRADIPFSFVVMESKSALQRAIAARTDRDEAWKLDKSSQSSLWWEVNVYVTSEDTPEYALETAAHMSAHFLLSSQAGTAVPSWLDEGAAHLAATAIPIRALTTCRNFELSAVPIDLRKVGDWDEAARRLVAEGLDPPFGKLARARDNELTQEGYVKCRSLVSWLLAHCPKAPRRIAAAAAHAPSVEDLLLRVMGATPDAIDRRWRLWALRP